MYINAEELVKVTLLILIVGMFKSKQNKTMHMEAQLCPPPLLFFQTEKKNICLNLSRVQLSDPTTMWSFFPF